MRRLLATLTASFAAAIAVATSAPACRAADAPPPAAAADQWVVYEGGEGPGKGKHVVFVAGDEEYRSEEALPQLAKILAKRHGFKCTVVFSVDDKGEINPKHQSNTPGLAALDSADLMVILTRFRAPPPEQMKHIDAYLTAGKPVIGLRTATHAFSGIKGDYERYNYNYKGKDGKDPEWSQGFGRLVLGETWINHHGDHKSQATRGVFAPDAKGNPLLNGINDGEIWGATDVYGVRLPLPGDSKPLVLGQVLVRKGPAVKGDKNFGLSPQDTPLEGKKNDPMMPVAWTKSYTLPGGKPGKAFTTTMGSSTDLENEALRRLLVNAAFQLVGLSVPEKADVGIVGEYAPSAYGFDGHKKGVKPADLKKME